MESRLNPTRSNFRKDRPRDQGCPSYKRKALEVYSVDELVFSFSLLLLFPSRLWMRKGVFACFPVPKWALGQVASGSRSARISP
jgi:hypothetical protein